MMIPIYPDVPTTDEAEFLPFVYIDVKMRETWAAQASRHVNKKVEPYVGLLELMVLRR